MLLKRSSIAGVMREMMTRQFLTRIVFSMILLLSNLQGVEFKKDTLLRDSEIEDTLKLFTEPIFKVAGLDPKRLRLFLIANNAINAAASLDHMMFINTGLIAKSKNPEELIGVLAHETGHIAGGHLAQREGHMKKSSLMAMASMALGAAAMIAGASTGNGSAGEAGMGIMMGGAQSAMGNFLHYGRGQEASADQAGLNYLKDLGWSGQGLYDFLKMLSKQELLSASRQDAYLLTHPLSSERVQLVSRSVESSPFTNTKLPQAFYDRFDRIVAKVVAFMESPMTTRLKYRENDTRPAALYARAIAFYRDKKFPQSLALLDQLIASYPQDPYYYEMKGQVLFDGGHIAESIEAYNKALSFKPDAHLIRIARIQAQLELGQESNLDRMIAELKDVLKHEKENGFAWHILAMTYGKQGKTGHVALALAEEAVTHDDADSALQQGRRALALLPQGPEKLRARDLVNEALRVKGQS